MLHATVNDRALRQLVREALGGNIIGAAPPEGEEKSVVVNDVVDQSAPDTDPMNQDFVPQTRAELDVAVRRLAKDLPQTAVPNAYVAIKRTIEDETEKALTGDEMKRDEKKPTKDTQAEAVVRNVVRKLLNEITPRNDWGYSGTDYGERNTDYDDDEEPGRKFSTMTDVDGATFDEIATELGFSVAGAKQFVDKTMQKAQWVGSIMQNDPDELEIMVLTAAGDYVDMLARTGELSSEDVMLMKDHPDVIRELSGFREFLSNRIRKMRKDERPEGDV